MADTPKFTLYTRLLKEVLNSLQTLPNKGVKNAWFKDTYEICREISKFLKQNETK